MLPLLTRTLRRHPNARRQLATSEPTTGESTALHMGTQPPRRPAARVVWRLSVVVRAARVLGPGVITGAADDDPSGIGTYSQAGAAFGTAQLWLALYMLPLIIAVQEMCGRIGLVTGQGIAAVVRDHYSRWILFGTVLLVLIANTLNIGADLGGMAAAVRLFVPDAPFIAVVILLALGILVLEVFVPYQRYAVILKVLTLSLLAYVATGCIVGVGDINILRATLVPSLQFTPAFLALVVGVLGTTISPYLFFWQASEEVEELEAHARTRRHIPPAGTPSTLRPKQRRFSGRVRMLRIDTVLGMVASEIATWFIIFTTGRVLYAHGVTNISTAAQAAAALEPLVQGFPHAGELAKGIFAMGIVGVGLLGVPVLAGSAAYCVAEAFAWHEGLAKRLTQARGFYGVIALSTLLGMVLNLLHINPMAALVYAAIINGVVAAPLLIVVMRVANNRAIMGTLTNGWLANVVGIVTILAMGFAAVAMAIAALP